MHAWIELSERSILNNIKNIKYFAKDKIGFVLKGNAYGHGLIEIANILKNNNYLNNLNYLIVQFEEEAEILNSVNINQNILILSPYLNENFLKNGSAEYLIYSIDCLKQIINFAKKYNKTFKIHLKFDTGMNRLGIEIDKIEECLDLLKNNKNYINLVAIATHCHHTRIYDTKITLSQSIRFNSIINILKKECFNFFTHAYASGAIDVNNEYNMIRTGSFLYGLYKSSENAIRLKENYNNFELEQVLTLKTRILQIKYVDVDQHIGYGIHYISECKKKIAIIGIGYSDGYNFKLALNSYVIIKNQYSSVIGVCMGLTIIDITNLNDIDLNDEVIILNKDYEKITIDYSSNLLNIINLVLVAGLNPLIKKIVN